MDKKARVVIFVAIVVIGVVFALRVYAARPQCNNGIDDDGDSLIDFPDDPGCSKKGDKDESNDPVTTTTSSITTTTSGTSTIADSCFDLDGGFRPFEYGNVSGTQNGNHYNFVDNCVNSTFLDEQFCNGVSPSNGLYICNTTCSNGVCI